MGGVPPRPARDAGILMRANHGVPPLPYLEVLHHAGPTDEGDFAGRNQGCAGVPSDQFAAPMRNTTIGGSPCIADASVDEKNQ